MAESSSSPQLFGGCVNSDVTAIELGEYIIEALIDEDGK